MTGCTIALTQCTWQEEPWVWAWICPTLSASGSLLPSPTPCWEVSVLWPTQILYSLSSYSSAWWVCCTYKVLWGFFVLGKKTVNKCSRAPQDASKSCGLDFYLSLQCVPFVMTNPYSLNISETLMNNTLHTPWIGQKEQKRIWKNDWWFFYAWYEDTIIRLIIFLSSFDTNFQQDDRCYSYFKF